MNKKLVAIDIDGILTIETQGYNYSCRTPNLAAIKLVNLLSEFCIVYLYTARYKQDRKITEKWLQKHNVKYNEIVFEKKSYDYLIDDKAI